MRRKPLFPPPQDARGKRKANKGRQRTTFLTIQGRISLQRRWWHSADEGSEVPADQCLVPDGENVTPGVREMCCRLNNDGVSFDQVAENLARTAQVQLSGEQLRQLVEREGRLVLAAQRTAELPVSFTAAECVVAGKSQSTRMYVGVDGVMVPTITDTEKQQRRTKVVQKRRLAEQAGKRLRPLPPRRNGTDQPYKEFKTITFYSEDGKHRHIVLSRARRTKVGLILRRESARLRFREAGEKIANVDGASWIPPQLDDADLRLDGRGLDFYHLSENVHAARRRVYGDETAEGTAWVEALLHTLKHEGYERAFESLNTWRNGLRGKKREAATKLLNYMVERRDMINYPEFLKKGWQIGSGPTEARCKTSTVRLKRSGQRWDMRHAEEVAALGNLRDSGQWHDYWASVVRPRT